MPESNRGNAGLSLAAIHSLKKGEVVGCYFDGFEEPEMIKDRPVMILSVSPARPGLAIIVPLSTTPPSRIELWHHKLSTASLWDKRPRWAKCDMVYSLSAKRFFLWRTGRDPRTRQRSYLRSFFISEEDFRAIQLGVMHALNLHPQK
jgi:mRNA interferase MazF